MGTIGRRVLTVGLAVGAAVIAAAPAAVAHGHKQPLISAHVITVGSAAASSHLRSVSAATISDAPHGGKLLGPANASAPSR